MRAPINAIQAPPDFEWPRFSDFPSGPDCCVVTEIDYLDYDISRLISAQDANFVLVHGRLHIRAEHYTDWGRAGIAAKTKMYEIVNGSSERQLRVATLPGSLHYLLGAKLRGQTMDREKLREGYLAQAAAADEKADKATDPVVKESLRKVAMGFRAMARDTLIDLSP